MDRQGVRAWVALYEELWREAAAERLGELVTEDATYQVSPWAEPLRGIDAIRDLWDAEDDSEARFEMRSEVVAVDGDVAVVRVEVDYTASGDRWRDLWVLRFEGDRCAAFEEWPFAPDQPDGH